MIGALASRSFAFDFALKDIQIVALLRLGSSFLILNFLNFLLLIKQNREVLKLRPGGAVIQCGKYGEADRGVRLR